MISSLLMKMQRVKTRKTTCTMLTMSHSIPMSLMFTINTMSITSMNHIAKDTLSSPGKINSTFIKNWKDNFILIIVNYKLYLEFTFNKLTWCWYEFFVLFWSKSYWFVKIKLSFQFFMKSWIYFTRGTERIFGGMVHTGYTHRIHRKH